jgi:hypothetical protein
MIRIIVLTIMLGFIIFIPLTAKAEEIPCDKIRWALSTFSLDQIKAYMKQHGIGFKRVARVKKSCHLYKIIDF